MNAKPLFPFPGRYQGVPAGAEGLKKTTMKYALLLLLCFSGLSVNAQIERSFGLRVGGLLTDEYDNYVYPAWREKIHEQSSIVQPLVHGFRRRPWGRRFGWQLEIGYTGGGYQVKDPLERDFPSRVVAHQLQTSGLVLYQYATILNRKQYVLLGLTHSYTAILTVRQSRYQRPVSGEYTDGERHYPWVQTGIGGAISNTNILGWELRLAITPGWNLDYDKAYQFSLTWQF